MSTLTQATNAGSKGPAAPISSDPTGAKDFSSSVSGASCPPAVDEPIGTMVPSDVRQNKRLSQGAASDGLASNLRAKKKTRPPLDTGVAPARTSRVRFLICTLGLVSLSMSQMSRMVLNLTITQMVETTTGSTSQKDNELTNAASHGSCPWPEDELSTDQVAGLSTFDNERTDTDDNLDSLADFEDVLDPEDRLTTQTTVQLATGTTSNASQPATPTTVAPAGAERFHWSINQQSTLLGGFFYSYFLFMVLGGRVAEMYGAKYVLLLAVAGSAVINVLTPWMARTNFVLLVMSRVIMGAIQAGVFPGMYALISKWLTMSEASIYTPLIKMNLRVGMVLGSLIPGLVSSWPNVFYLTGALNALWAIVWLLVATSNPAECTWVSEGELKHIMRKKRLPAATAIELNQDGSETRRKKKKTPWLKILTAPSVIGLIIVKLTFNYSIDFLSIELPSYLTYVHHASKEKISAITSVMFAIQVFLIVFVGWLAKVMIAKRPFGFSKTTIRKIFQGVASLGMAISLFAMTFNDYNLVYVSVLLQIVSLLSMFTAGGETMLPYDLSEEYPATIMAIANSIANLSAVTTTIMTGLILGDQSGSYERWNLLIYIIVGANLFGGSMFLLLVKAESIDFEDGSGSSEKANENATSGPDDRFDDVELTSTV